MRPSTYWMTLLIVAPLVGCSQNTTAPRLSIDTPAKTEQKPEAKTPLRDYWDAAYLEGARTGFFHTTISEDTRNGQKVFVTTQEMTLTLKRYKAVIKQRLQQTIEENADGKVLGWSLTTFSDKGDPQIIKGRIEGNKLLVKSGATPELPFPWDDKVLGPYRQEQLLKEKKLKPGESLEYFNFEPSVMAGVKVKVQAREEENVDVLQVKESRTEKPVVSRVETRLLRLEGISDKVVIAGVPLALPRVTFWVDRAQESVRMQMDTPGLGVMTLYRCSEAVARMEGVAPDLMPDLGLNSLITLNKEVKNIHGSRKAIYRITVKDDDDPSTVFVQDDRQRVIGSDGKTVRLETQRQKVEPKDGPRPADEYLKSSFFLDSDNEGIRQQAAAIVGTETDNLKKALLIESWVKKHMHPTSDVGYAQASTIVKELKGDCRQHGMLTAALCRAAGIPARTALGLVYAHDQDKDQVWKPILGFHMWTEVWINGQWLGLDATLGQGGIGPGHLKISQHSWADTQTLAPLLPVSRAMGKIKVEIEEVE